MKVVYSRQRTHVKKPTGKTTAGDILTEKIDLLFAMKQSKTGKIPLLCLTSFTRLHSCLFLLLSIRVKQTNKRQTKTKHTKKLRWASCDHHIFFIFPFCSLFSPLDLGFCPRNMSEIVPVKVPNYAAANSLVFSLSSSINLLFNHSCLL